MARLNKSANEREHSKKRRRTVLRLFGLLFFFYLLLSFFLGDMGLLRYMKMHKQKEALNAEIASLKSANDELAERVRSLRTDPEYIEHLAREQGMVKDGETVYLYEDEK